jgi:predicted metal-dependent phosphoesterase TrpH
MVDLHIHSTCSDGSLSPAALVQRALRLGLRAIALTDHDGVSGNAEALLSGAELGLPVIPGIEISTQWQGLTFHLLGYGLRHTGGAVASTLEFLLDCRRRRNPLMVQKLRDLDIDITLDEVRRVAGGEVVGRPHFARVLLDKGVVTSTQDAFDRYLGRGARAYVDKTRLEPRAACQLVRDAGGVPVLAHPGLIERDHPGRLEPLLEELVALGLEGVEAYYSGHDPGQTLRYRNLARSRGLLVTGGSDFHAPDPRGPELGSGFGSLLVPDVCWETLQERLDMAR